MLHATDEIVTEFATETYSADAPLHITALRTASAKYATYSNWRPDTIEVLERHQEGELYDYRTPAGLLELDNTAGRSPQEEVMRAKLERAIAAELREQLPPRLHAAQARGFHNYLTTARQDARVAAALRRRRQITILGGEPAAQPPPTAKPKKHRHR